MFAVLFVCAICICAQNAQRTPLDEYVEKSDPHYSWSVIGTYLSEDTGLPYSSYLLNMTSQMWQTEAETNQPLWYHYVIIVVPNNLLHTDAAFMMIDNGELTGSAPTPGTDGRFNSTAEYALGTRSVGVDLKMVPNQPLKCQGDPEGRTRREDDLIAWTWRRFLDDPSDPEILLQLPMTKAAVKAMDAVSEFSRTLPGNLDISSFMLSGGSKIAKMGWSGDHAERGWTTYLAAAVDRRVFAIAPSVLTCLNFVPVLRHQYRAYGGWSFSQIDYYRENITAEVENPNMQLMMDIIDPYVYRDRLTMPKLIIMASGDEHFMPDDTWYFFEDFIGPKYMWWLENSGHSISSSQHGSLIRPNIIAFYNAVKNSELYQLPNIRWQRNETGEAGIITVWTDKEPVNITAVYGDTNGSERRDFRMNIGTPDPSRPTPNPITWTEQPVEQVSGGVYRAEYVYPPEGWRCFAIKMTFNVPDGSLLYFTTESAIIPDIFPFADCSGTDCRGQLV